MIAQEFVHTILPIGLNSTTDDCLTTMLKLSCFQLPVLKGDKLVGSIGLEDCMDNPNQSIEKFVQEGFASVYYNTHIFDVMRVFNEAQSDCSAVLGSEFEFLGVITKSDCEDAIASSLTVEQQGAIVMIEMATSQYSSSEICRIVESENAQLLGLWLENVPDSGRIRASLKLNTKNAERIISGLIRFNYEVIASFGDDDYKENVGKRFQSLMKYLDI